jgi:hypothetical protein
VGEAFLRDGIAQRAHDVVLPEDIVKGFGPVFPCEDLVAHTGECRDLRRFVMAGFSQGGNLAGIRPFLPLFWTPARGIEESARSQNTKREVILSRIGWFAAAAGCQLAGSRRMRSS